MSEPAAHGLVWKLAEVMGEVERIPKNGYNEHFKYHFAAEQDVKTALRKALADRHIFLLSSIEDVSHEGSVTTIRTLHTFIDAETGERESFHWSSQGQDTQDKGVSKAATSAVKYALLDNFLIPTGEDPDAAGPVADQHGPRRQQAKPPAPPLTRTGAPYEPIAYDKAGTEALAYLGKALKPKGYTSTADVRREMAAKSLPPGTPIGVLLKELPDLTGGGQPPAGDAYEPSEQEIDFFGSRDKAVAAHQREQAQATPPAVPA